MKSLLAAGRSEYRWVAATVDANNAASYQLATGAPVMAIGGFNGTDPSPTLAQFERDVATHKIHYFIAGGGGFGGGPGRRERVGLAVDRLVGREQLHPEDGGRRDGLRPHDVAAGLSAGVRGRGRAAPSARTRRRRDVARRPEPARCSE